ncbi:MAG: T9SS type A sorting domain-containing protein [Bacteroidia bacterium]|nr:T9SS type A sorting domain-containing protein [Bacteroidia bacterium]
MKTQLTTIFLFIALIAGAQHEHVCAKTKQAAYAKQFSMQAKMASQPSPFISHEMKYDMKFVHLDLNVERINKNISGNVKTIATVTAATLDTFMTLLHKNYIIDSVYFNGSLFSTFRKDSMIKGGLTSPLANGSTFTTIVWYHGTAPSGGSAIGSGFSSQASWYGGGNRATWSLSEAIVAYHWWPTKQVLSDKIDSSWVFVTTDSTNMAGSNGVLTNVVNVGTKKRYEWKSHKPIAYYLISVAVSKFKEYNLYAKPQYLNGDSILIQNYIDAAAFTDPGWIANDKVQLNKMPATMNFLCDMYGMYPYYKEKYGHCMVPLGGGMEHTTMTTIGFFDFYVDAHELGHQWWGDQVTCGSWKDIWINEGFASYTEHLVAEYMDPSNFANNLDGVHGSVMSQVGGSIFFTGNDTMNSNRIFSSRLTYDKGGAIIHTLRFLTNNDSLWFNTLRGFQSTYKNKTASAIDFQNYYQAQTGINPTQFFSQWYYGEGYPTFNVTYNYTGDSCFIKSVQTTSKPTVTPLFITPMEYWIGRVGMQDTVIRVMHSNATEIYKIALHGTVSSVAVDPNNWVINKKIGPTLDPTLGVVIDETGVGEISGLSKGIKIGPNPTKGTFEIMNTNGQALSVKVFDISGKFLFVKNITSETTVDLGNYSKGVYFVQLFDSSSQLLHSQKIVKE